MGANFLRFNGFVFSVVGDVSVNNETSMVTSSISRIDLPAQSSKMLIRVGFVRVCYECLRRSFNECSERYILLDIYLTLTYAPKDTD